MKAAKWSIGAMSVAGLLLAMVLGFALLVWKVSLVAQPTALPMLSKEWHDQVYGLDPDEVVRFVPPPYSPQRMKDFARGWAGAPPKNVLGQLAYHVLATRTINWGMSSGLGNLASGPQWSTKLTSPDLDIAADLKWVAADGDWIVRIDSPVDGQMKALESILSAVTAKELRFEKKLVERDVIIARGTYVFHEDQNYTTLATQAGIGRPRAGEVHLYTLPLSPILGGGGGSGELASLFEILESSTHRKFVDDVQAPRPKSISWSNNSSQYSAAGKETKLDQLLAIVQKQTSLQFSKEKRAMPVWFVREKLATTQPVNSK
jgi:hypothetical protein